MSDDRAEVWKLAAKFVRSGAWEDRETLAQQFERFGEAALAAQPGTPGTRVDNNARQPLICGQLIGWGRTCWLVDGHAGQCMDGPGTPSPPATPPGDVGVLVGALERVRDFAVDPDDQSCSECGGYGEDHGPSADSRCVIAVGALAAWRTSKPGAGT